jgi:ubiquinone/menaquinone biosynthesis C-methylase UbiE
MNMDTKYWAPNEDIHAWLAQSIEPNAKVLEIGPGNAPFSRSTHFVRRPGDSSGQPNTIHRDITVDTLPLEDKSFDFVYCRHVIEDVYNPFLLLNEMQRVGKRGYIETPSPMAELTRGIDGCPHANLYRGYIHHRWIVWTSGSELHIVEKSTQVEHLDFDGSVELADPFSWNTSLLWNDAFKVVHHQHDIDFLLQSTYGKLLGTAIEKSRESIRNLESMVFRQGSTDG